MNAVRRLCCGCRVAAVCIAALLIANAIQVIPALAVTTEQVKQACAELETLAEKTLQSTGVPGIAIAVVHNDEVVFIRGLGVREAGKPELIDVDTVFQLASVSKPITTSVLAVLVGEGAIDWDDRVIDRDPGFCLYDAASTRELRLRDLLCHRSSLPDHCGDLLEDMGYGRDEILHRLRYQPPASSFRSAYAYTNYGFTEAAVAAARAVGKPWEDVAAEKLFQPLGMTSTSARFADYVGAANHALLHVKVDGRWTAKNTRQPDAQSPAGGVSSTLRDMTRWLRYQLAGGRFEGRQVAAAAALAETHSPQIVTDFRPADGSITCYGLGWNVAVQRQGRVLLKHSGGFDLGMRTEVALLPAEQVGIVVLSNAGPTGLPEAMTESFFDWLLDGKLGRDWVEFANRMFDEQVKREHSEQTDYSQPPPAPRPALPLDAYAGTYRNEFFGNITIVRRDKALELQVGPRKMPFALRAWDRDMFICQPIGEMAGGPSGVEFSLGPEGTASCVLIENLNIHGMGRFERVSEPR